MFVHTPIKTLNKTQLKVYMQLNLFQDKDSEAIKSQMKRLRRQIIVNSIIYYRFGDNIISDAQYDRIARKLKELQVAHPDLSKEVEFYEDFKTWQDDTCPSGYDLKSTTYPDMISKAQYILDIHYGRKKEKESQ